MKKRTALVLTFVFMTVLVAGLTLPVIGQEKPKAETPAKEMAIARAVVATGVENKEPVGEADAFPASTEKVYCFIEAADIGKDTEVSFVWFQGDKEMRKINVPLDAGPKWRTWTYKNIGGQKGEWKVEIRDAEGKVLKDLKFKVE